MPHFPRVAVSLRGRERCHFRATQFNTKLISRRVRLRFISRRMSISFPLFASCSAKNQTKARRFGSQHLGVLLSVPLVGALIFASGCGSSSSTKTTVPPPGGQSIYVPAVTGESVFPVTASGNVAPTTAFTVDGGT